MKFNFDKSINEKLSFLYESLFDDETDDILNNDEESPLSNVYNDEKQFNDFLNDCNKLDLFYRQWNSEKYIERLQEEKKINHSNVIYLKQLSLAFKDQKQFDKFCNMFDCYPTLKLYIGYLELDMNFDRNGIPNIKFNFNNFNNTFIDVDTISIYGGIFENLEGINETISLKNIHFNNSYVKSINGLLGSVRILDFLYNKPIESVTDWSNLQNMTKLYRLTVDYTEWKFIGIDHLLHFNNIPEEILDIKEVNFINHDAFGKLRYYKNYIKNMFIEENPNVKGKLKSNIIRQLQGNYEPILHGRK